MAFSPDSLQFAIADKNDVKTFDVRTGKETCSLHGHADSVNALAFSPDGKWIATAGDDATLRLWKAANGEFAAVIAQSVDHVRPIDIHEQ